MALADTDTVDHVELARYLGLWYEIARLPMWAEDQAARDVTAEYFLKEDGKIRVVNRCINEDGKIEEAKGEAVPEDEHNAKLRVTFAPKGLRWLPFAKADYWILKLDANYNTALVGTPDRKYLWLLSRNATLDGVTQLAFLEHANRLGFNLDKLILPEQSGTVARTDAHVIKQSDRGPQTRKPASIVIDDDLWLLEERFWRGDTTFFDAHLIDEAVMVFPAPLGTMDREKTLASLEEGGRWENVELNGKRLFRPSASVAILLYAATAMRAGQSPYGAQCMSVYCKDGNFWKLAAHQQTPSWVDLNKAPAS